MSERQDRSVRPAVLVCIVTYNSAVYLVSCLESLRRQTYPRLEVAVWDNASSDESYALVRAAGDIVHHAYLSHQNVGCAAANNRLLEKHGSEYVLFLNPDALLPPDFIQQAAEVMERHPGCGSLSPRICRYRQSEGRIEKMRQLDSTGIVWRRNQRHLDRGSDEEDQGQYDRREYVFGVTGAVAFYRRACLADVAEAGQVWDEDFFCYREDADLAWRCNWKGWRCLYEPALTAWHVRQVLPRNRRQVAAALNMHSVKNRFLLRLKNMPWRTQLRLLPWILGRDLLVLGYLPVREPRSLVALWKVVRLTPRFWRKRRRLLGNARVSTADMARWFVEEARPIIPAATPPEQRLGDVVHRP